MSAWCSAERQTDRQVPDSSVLRHRLFSPPARRSASNSSMQVSIRLPSSDNTACFSGSRPGSGRLYSPFNSSAIGFRARIVSIAWLRAIAASQEDGVPWLATKAPERCQTFDINLPATPPRLRYDRSGYAGIWRKVSGSSPCRDRRKPSGRPWRCGLSNARFPRSSCRGPSVFDTMPINGGRLKLTRGTATNAQGIIPSVKNLR